MIDVYTWVTPNGRKIHIMLEEVGMPYTVIPVDIAKGEQFAPSFLALNANGKIPVIVDRDGPAGNPHTVFESAAILVYLAEKSGRLLPPGGRARYEVLRWLMFQHTAFGPYLGQFHHFLYYAPEAIPSALHRYRNEVSRLYQVLDRRLSDREFVAGDYSIADIAIWPWARLCYRHEQDIFDYPHLNRWFHTIALRPAVVRAMEVLKGRLPRDSDNTRGKVDSKVKDVLWGAAQYQTRS
jgi:GSH-dependent disulfide-bond oxidoreductase